MICEVAFQDKIRAYLLVCLRHPLSVYGLALKTVQAQNLKYYKTSTTKNYISLVVYEYGLTASPPNPYLSTGRCFVAVGDIDTIVNWLPLFS